MTTRLVIGGSGGLGRAFVEALRERHPDERLFWTSRQPQASETDHLELDYQRPETFESLVLELGDQIQSLDQIIVATGLLHDQHHRPEKTVRELDPEFLQQVFWVNTLAPMLVLRELLSKIDRKSTVQIALLSARVGSISDNRLGGWYGYRASKAALNQMIKTLAIETQRTHPKLQLLALHPGTTDTALSKPFQARVPPGKLFTPEFAANAMLDVMNEVRGGESGQFLAWDGQTIPW